MNEERSIAPGSDEEFQAMQALVAELRALLPKLDERQHDLVGLYNQHGPRTEYKAGTRVVPDSWDDNWQDECSHGIHFFITREEAEAWK